MAQEPKPRVDLDLEPYRLVLDDEPPPRPGSDPESESESAPPSPVDWNAVFGNTNPVELEIGCGKGLFLANSAVERPGHNFLGVEIARKYALRAVERLAKKALPNAKVLRDDARRFLHRVPARSVAALHIYFPDPWWKKRHRKRRMFDDEFVRHAARVLVPGGEFRFATDVAEYFDVMREVVARNPAFQPLPPEAVAPRDPRHPLDYLTNFERKYRIEGRPIHYAAHRLDPGAGNPENETETETETETPTPLS